MNASPQPRPHKPELLLFTVLAFSLFLVNPWIRGDGVGYYSFVRAPLIQRNLDFQPDYQRANASFRTPRMDVSGQPRQAFRTPTGHLENHFSVGPAILWSPFLLLTHAGVLAARAMGSTVAADGFSAPYRLVMALATALYGFLGLLISFRLARKYACPPWALLATIAIWWASSLPVYMYFNPSWSHAHSAFAVALFLWYWHETREPRTLRQWIILALIAGLMLNVYYANAMILAVLAVEAIRQYISAFRSRQARGAAGLFFRHLLFGGIVFLCMFPTFIAHYVIYGSPFESGYTPLDQWSWRSPYFLAVLFSANHGLLAWTPILIFAVVGLFFFWRRFPSAGAPFLAAALAFYVFIAAYPDWAGISSYGNRFFVSLTPLWILGMATILDRAAVFFRSPRAASLVLSPVILLFILWNAGFMFQWGTHLVPARGPISWSQMIHNQFAAVPREVGAKLQFYLFRRKELMRQIEDKELQQLSEPDAE